MKIVVVMITVLMLGACVPDTICVEKKEWVEVFEVVGVDGSVMLTTKTSQRCSRHKQDWTKK